MKKEQTRAYIEILENLKRDLAEEGEVDIKRIRANIEGYASGAYTKDGDELIVIPSSCLDEIFGGHKKSDCRKCKSFIECSVEKQVFYSTTKHNCKEFKEAKQ
jgi:hypothetical protein